MKDKLIELLRAGEREFAKECRKHFDCRECSCFIFGYSPNCLDALTADYLLANGVTIQRWIPVEERLPKGNEIVLFYADNNGAVYRGKYAFTGKRGAVCFSVRGERGREAVYSGITHWMPLPEPPKEE